MCTFSAGGAYSILGERLQHNALPRLQPCISTKEPRDLIREQRFTGFDNTDVASWRKNDLCFFKTGIRLLSFLKSVPKFQMLAWTCNKCNMRFPMEKMVNRWNRLFERWFTPDFPSTHLPKQPPTEEMKAMVSIS